MNYRMNYSITYSGMYWKVMDNPCEEPMYSGETSLLTKLMIKMKHPHLKFGELLSSKIHGGMNHFTFDSRRSLTSSASRTSAFVTEYLSRSHLKFPQQSIA